MTLTMCDIIVDPPDEGDVVDPISWFDTPGPFELEIGCGKGGFLLDRARSRPDVRLLGIEWANKYFKFAADRMARWNITNVRLMRTDARHFVIHHLRPACVATLHLYHPDPWPKKRHHKRRLVCPEFVVAAARCIHPGGYWLIQTDHRDYFDVIRAAVGGDALFDEVSWPQDAAPTEAEWPGTNFEIKYVREGRQIYRVAYRRAGPAKI